MLFLALTYPTAAITRGQAIYSGNNHVPRDGGLDDSFLHALWVYGHVAWLNTLAVEPGWIGAVYQGQKNPSNAAMHKICD